MSRGGQIYYYVVDGLGSTTLVTDSAAVVKNNYVYDAFGVVRSSTAPVVNPLGYASREFGEAGFWYNRYRSYSPGQGRFLSVDPLIRAAAQGRTSAEGPVASRFPQYLYTDNSP